MPRHSEARESVWHKRHRAERERAAAVRHAEEDADRERARALRYEEGDRYRNRWRRRRNAALMMLSAIAGLGLTALGLYLGVEQFKEQSRLTREQFSTEFESLRSSSKIARCSRRNGQTDTTPE